MGFRGQPTRPELIGTFGMVASTHWIASACGMSVLERGGNAIDAAVAAGFVLQVVEPHLNGPGGEAPVLLWSAADRAAHVVCGQGTSPAAATIERFSRLGLSGIPGTGLLAATVPGAFGAWMLLLERWGTWRLRDVLAYAIAYCVSGYPTLPTMAATIESVRDLFVVEWPTSAAQWLDSAGRTPAPGSRVTNPGLAATYQRVLYEAERPGASREQEIGSALDVWYSGFVADAIDGFCSSTSWVDTSGRRHSGLLTGADLAGWKATSEMPVSFQYGPYLVCKTASWGQGPVLLQQLAFVSSLNLDQVDLESPAAIHFLVEAAKLAFADREAWYGEGAPQGVVDQLLSSRYIDTRRALIAGTASYDLRPGSPGGRPPLLPFHPDAAGSVGPGHGEPAVAGTVAPAAGRGPVEGDTCHLDVVDRHGNMVSATPSGGWLQSSPTIPELGFCLGTRAQMFSFQPGLPNSLRPGARPRTTLSPSLVLQNGEPWMAFGTPGGDQQDQWGLLFLLRVIHGGLSLQDAIDGPAFHSEHFPSSFYPHASHPGRLVVEDRFDPATLRDLRHRGHEVFRTGPWSLGRLSAVLRQDGFLKAAANPRGAQGYAVGR